MNFINNIYLHCKIMNNKKIFLLEFKSLRISKNSVIE